MRQVLRAFLLAAALVCVSVAIESASSSAPFQRELETGALQSPEQSPDHGKPAVPPGPADQDLRRRPVKVTRATPIGTVVTRGVLKDQDGDGVVLPDECDFDFSIETSLESGYRRISIEKGSDCTMRIVEVEDVDAVEGAADAQPQADNHIETALPGLLARLWNAFVPGLGAVSGPKRVAGYVWMYGFGGSWDVLTEQRGFIDWSWNYNQNAWSNAIFGYCDPVHYDTGWRAGVCAIRETISAATGPTGYLTRLNEGNFYWLCPSSPTGCYKHTLLNRTSGNTQGIGTCGGAWSGSIVRGVTQSCKVQQPPPCGVGVICWNRNP